jgi:probable F420-dependent oxidoreductase
VDLGRVGVWWSGSWKDPDDPERSAATALEALGYATLWSSGGFEPGLASHFERLLASTERVAVASGIVSIWMTPPDQLAAAVARLEAAYPGRFLLGVGASHHFLAPDYTRPYSHMVAFLNALDAADTPVPPQRRVLAALRPKMLELAATRAAGAHPYFVPVEHTAHARQILGDGPLLVPEVAVVLRTDPAEARDLARRYASIYLPAPNYAQNLRDLGYGDEDFDGEGSDRLIDAVIPWGDAATVAGRIREHHDAGADQVAIQVVDEPGAIPLQGYRELATALGLR